MSTIINFLRSVIDAIIRFFETVKDFFIYLWDIIENLPAVMEKYGIKDLNEIIGGAH